MLAAGSGLLSELTVPPWSWLFCPSNNESQDRIV